MRAGVLSERGAPEQGAADGVKMMDERQESLAGYFFEHFNADFAIGNLSQSRDTGLVFALDLGGVALAEHASTVGGSQNQLKTVGDLSQTIFNCDACHGVGFQKVNRVVLQPKAPF